MKTPFPCLLLLLLIAILPSSYSQEDDIKCLKGLKQALQDPQGILTQWSFPNKTTPGFICSFLGATCWNALENRIIALQLSHFQLQGNIPDSLRFCSSLQTLDLSRNSLSGRIPSKICSWLPYLVTLDLSDNQLSGGIPPDLGNCRYLNKLVLSGNHLSGSIPLELSDLRRLSVFSVANNNLSGSIPPGLAGFGSSAFAGNHGLCGKPTGSKCHGLS